jgi:hypothetical protein
MDSDWLCQTVTGAKQQTRTGPGLQLDHLFPTSVSCGAASHLIRRAPITHSTEISDTSSSFTPISVSCGAASHLIRRAPITHSTGIGDTSRSFTPISVSCGAASHLYVWATEGPEAEGAVRGAAEEGGAVRRPADAVHHLYRVQTSRCGVSVQWVQEG